MVEISMDEIRDGLQDAMRSLEEAVSNSWQYVNNIRDNASLNIKDPKPVDDLYAQLRAMAGYEYKLFDTTRKYLKQVDSDSESG